MTKEDINARLHDEVEKRVEYYEQNGIDESTKMSKIHYVIAAIVAMIGLTMTIMGAVIQ